MELVYGCISVSTIVLAAFFLTRISRPSATAEFTLFWFNILTGLIIGMGYVLSWMNCIATPACWALFSVLVLLSIVSMALLMKRFRRLCFRKPATANVPALKQWYGQLSSYDKKLLWLLLTTMGLVGAINLAVVLFSAPHNWDGMTYHLARVAYYIQQGNLDYFDANYWAQVSHPKNSSVLFLYAYLVTDRNENLTQLVQFISYWVAVCSVYGISRAMGTGKSWSLFACLIFGLLIENLMQSVTTQNDMVITAYIGSAVYSLVAYKQARNSKYLVFAGLSIALAVGVKASAFLVLPSLLIVAVFALLRGSDETVASCFRGLKIFAISLILWVSFSAFVSGYWDNYRIFGHPLGPETYRKVHSYEGKPINYVLSDGSKNLIRYTLEFLFPDGLPPLGLSEKVRDALRMVPAKLIRGFGIKLETDSWLSSFSYTKKEFAQEDFSYWGVLGFGLIWIVIIFYICGLMKSSWGRVLSLATVAFLFVQSYAGPYDPWRGRYFITSAIFAVPPVGCALSSIKKGFSKPIRLYLIAVVLMGCLSAISAIIFRANRPIISMRLGSTSLTSVFSMDRLEQLTRTRPAYHEPIEKFESLVPKDATVAVHLYDSSYEYPLFGEKLTRTIIPVNSFWRGPQPIPEAAEYLLYYEGAFSWYFPLSDEPDVHLGADWYLRDLTKDNHRSEEH
ncbi:MAG: hypothetical protein C4532_02415 [Candidatus Abyssobacteria bacterium SURF_17]|uniref:Glycosyltransferase RgtA/B/C/D-like domain-containing protein n=1 Tax=Candidatus Abyssobacteria bacterium SURF_17 TaxID=2093361 RepID=A0A419F7N0_9BACT|nr:MAG: hypothetical protein C4532_02415 [Candidatus Abyssubacteria bacterium SURF_17]